MADIRIHREHALGLAKARKIAAQWADDVRDQFDMRCSLTEGDFSDTVHFQRSGVSGQLIVAADHFDLQAKLGFLLGAFSKTIESEILKNLDDLLGQAQPAAAKAPKTPARPASTSGSKPASKPTSKPANKASAGVPGQTAGKSAGRPGKR
jgi:putative polyhydroxyalkanoate system protein